MSNPFQQAEPWEVSLDTLLPVGNHVVTIAEATPGESSGKHFQIELRLENQQGSIRDWMVITPNSAGKVVALANAAHVDLPADEDVIDTAKLVLSDSYVHQFVGQRVGVVIREEQDYQDPTKMRLRVQGYVDPDRVKPSSDVTSPVMTSSFRSAPAPNVEVPF